MCTSIEFQNDPEASGAISFVGGCTGAIAFQGSCTGAIAFVSCADATSELPASEMTSFPWELYEVSGIFMPDPEFAYRQFVNNSQPGGGGGGGDGPRPHGGTLEGGHSTEIDTDTNDDTPRRHPGTPTDTTGGGVVSWLGGNAWMDISYASLLDGQWDFSTEDNSDQALLNWSE